MPRAGGSYRLVELSPSSSGDSSRAVLITERDRLLLTFASRHRLLLPDHVRALLGVSPAAAHARLRSLTRAGYLTRKAIFHHQPACFQVTRHGLAATGSTLRPPRIDLRCYEHDVGVAWLWLAARNGAFGQLREIIAERHLRSHDQGRDAGDRRFGVGLGGVGPRGGERLHYPDLLLVTADGRRIALELELTPKGRGRRERILAAYAADARIDAVLYLVEHGSAARALQASARRLGISSLVHVQPVRSTVPRPRSRPDRAVDRQPTRDRAAAGAAGRSEEVIR